MFSIGLSLLALLVLGCLAVFAVHFIPAFLAFSRNHSARWAILLVNIFFGWTIIGWVITLVWALSEPAVPAGPGRV